MRSLIKGFVAVAVVSTAFIGGFTADILKEAPRNPAAAAWRLQAAPSILLSRLFGPAAAQAAARDKNSSPTDVYYQVMSTIREDYYSPGGKPAARNLTYAAIDGMLATLGDRYTEFWTPEETRRKMEETSGNFVGIGARLDVTRDKRVVVLEPIPNSPASRKGVLAGDIILAVDGKSTRGMELDDVIEMIRGEKKTMVTLTLERKGQAKPLVVGLTREVVHSPSVESRMQDAASGIGYIRLDQFTEDADEQFGAALRRLEKQGMRALIFDLRDNPGGLLNVAQELASRFIEKGPVVWVQERSGQMSSLNVEKRKHDNNRLVHEHYPVIVLVNDGSASASEIVAGAIKDHGVGTLLGTTTYGKGLVQTIIPLSDDSAVKITTQHYYTPRKIDINRKLDASGKQVSGGIKPDIEVEFTEKDMEAFRNARRDHPQDRSIADRMDPQLQKALGLLRERLGGMRTAAVK